jgi:hypothetical protein
MYLAQMYDSFITNKHIKGYIKIKKEIMILNVHEKVLLVLNIGPLNFLLHL